MFYNQFTLNFTQHPAGEVDNKLYILMAYNTIKYLCARQACMYVCN